MFQFSALFQSPTLSSFISTSVLLPMLLPLRAFPPRCSSAYPTHPNTPHFLCPKSWSPFRGHENLLWNGYDHRQLCFKKLHAFSEVTLSLCLSQLITVGWKQYFYTSNHTEMSLSIFQLSKKKKTNKQKNPNSLLGAKCCLKWMQAIASNPSQRRKYQVVCKGSKAIPPNIPTRRNVVYTQSLSAIYKAMDTSKNWLVSSE